MSSVHLCMAYRRDASNPHIGNVFISYRYVGIYRMNAQGIILPSVCQKPINTCLDGTGIFAHSRTGHENQL
jgi:hypothetical protein